MPDASPHKRRMIRARPCDINAERDWHRVVVAGAADAVGEVIDRGEFPVVLGGDCSILLGGLLALNRRGHYGLLFMDGHADFYNPEANPNGEAASMDLFFVAGRGPAVLTNIEG